MAAIVPFLTASLFLAFQTRDTELFYIPLQSINSNLGAAERRERRILCKMLFLAWPWHGCMTCRAVSAFCKLHQFLIIPWCFWQWFILGVVCLSNTSTAAPAGIGDFFFSLLSIPQQCPVADFVDYSPGFAPADCGSGVSPARAASCQTKSSQNIKSAERHFHVQDKVCLWELQNVHSEPPAASEEKKPKHFFLEINTQVVHPFLYLLAGVSPKKHN